MLICFWLFYHNFWQYICLFFCLSNCLFLYLSNTSLRWTICPCLLSFVLVYVFCFYFQLSICFYLLSLTTSLSPFLLKAMVSVRSRGRRYTKISPRYDRVLTSQFNLSVCRLLVDLSVCLPVFSRFFFWKL